MKKFLLSKLQPSVDLDFLSSTTVRYSFAGSNIGNYSWCSTCVDLGLIFDGDQLVFEAGDQDEVVLRLKFGQRLVELDQQ